MIIGLNNLYHNEDNHCHTSSISEGSSHASSSDKIAKKRKAKTKVKDINRYQFNFNSSKYIYCPDKIAEYLLSHNSTAIRDIIVQQQQYNLFYDNFTQIFIEHKSEFKYIIQRIPIDLSLINKYLGNLDIIEYLVSLNCKFSFLSKDIINLLWVHCCGLNYVEQLKIMIRNGFIYNYQRDYLLYSHTNLNNTSKSTLLLQLLENYPNFYNLEILNILDNLNFVLVNEFNIDYMIYKSTNFQLFLHFNPWISNVNIVDNSLRILIGKFISNGNVNYCNSIINHSFNEHIYSYFYSKIGISFIKSSLCSLTFIKFFNNEYLLPRQVLQIYHKYNNRRGNPCIEIIYNILVKLSFNDILYESTQFKLNNLLNYCNRENIREYLNEYIFNIPYRWSPPRSKLDFFEDRVIFMNYDSFIDKFINEFLIPYCNEYVNIIDKSLSRVCTDLINIIMTY